MDAQTELRLSMWRYRETTYPLGLYSMERHHAERSKRVPVTALWLWEHPDVSAWIMRLKDVYGETWTEISGCDRTTTGNHIILEYGRTGEMKVKPDFVVYVRASAVAPDERL